MSETLELMIGRVGAQGDGVAETPNGPVYVPFTLAGERIVAEVSGEAGRLLSITEPSAERVAPRCKHFGTCGGCKMQHVAPATYLAWKRELVASAFRARGIDVPVQDVVACNGPRRRAAMAARQTASGVLLGFHRAASHEIVDVEECPVLHNSIVEALPALRLLVIPLLPRNAEVRVTVTATQAGLDVAFDDVSAKLTPELRARIAAAATSARIARVSIDRDPVYEGLPPFLKLGRAEPQLPPSVFLQAVASMEEEMARRIIEALGSKTKAVADLFSGLGAFTFRIAERAKVFAADNDKAAIGALNAALRKTTGLKPVEARTRDLFREPLSATELRDFDAVVFDPPRAGADAQARMIARAKLKTVVAVSCNPATLARDARTLIDGGYSLESVTPLDQFLYSPHIEAVAVFRR